MAGRRGESVQYMDHLSSFSAIAALLHPASGTRTRRPAQIGVSKVCFRTCTLSAQDLDSRDGEFFTNRHVHLHRHMLIIFMMLVALVVLILLDLSCLPLQSACKHCSLPSSSCIEKAEDLFHPAASNFRKRSRLLFRSGMASSRWLSQLGPVPLRTES